jgi:alpha-beta hydrolase superfamily lysophospholipase
MNECRADHRAAPPAVRNLRLSGLLPRFDFYTARDGRRLAVRVWNSVDPPRARVVFLHGVASHGGWYTRSCHHLNCAGFEVHFLDRRGSGVNLEARGDVDHCETWIDDVAVYLEKIGNSRPVVLCGISWGGRLAAAVARQHAGLIRGLALLCPGLYSRFEPGIIQRMALGGPLPMRLRSRRVRIPLDQSQLFTETPRWRDYVSRDPLTLREVTIGFAQADRRLTRLARESAPYLHAPTLLVLGGRDRIVANSPTRAFLKRSAAVHKTLIEYPNGAHTLEFEADPSRYFSDLADWIGRTIAG